MSGIKVIANKKSDVISTNLVKKNTEFCAFQYEDVYNESQLQIFNQELESVLELNYNAFWSQVVYDKNLQLFLDTFLQNLSFLSLNNQIKDASLELRRLAKKVLCVYKKLGEQGEMKVQQQAQFLYNNWLFDIPKFIDISIVYGKQNEQTVCNLLAFLFSDKFSYYKDWEQAFQIILKEINSNVKKVKNQHDKLLNILQCIEAVTKCFPIKPVDLFITYNIVQPLSKLYNEGDQNMKQLCIQIPVNVIQRNIIQRQTNQDISQIGKTYLNWQEKLYGSQYIEIINEKTQINTLIYQIPDQIIQLNEKRLILAKVNPEEKPIFKVKDIFPDLDNKFIEKMLDYFKNDVDKTINSVLENNIPEPLKYAYEQLSSQKQQQQSQSQQQSSSQQQINQLNEQTQLNEQAQILMEEEIKKQQQLEEQQKKEEKVKERIKEQLSEQNVQNYYSKAIVNKNQQLEESLDEEILQKQLQREYEDEYDDTYDNAARFDADFQTVEDNLNNVQNETSEIDQYFLMQNPNYYVQEEKDEEEKKEEGKQGTNQQSQVVKVNQKYWEKKNQGQKQQVNKQNQNKNQKNQQSVNPIKQVAKNEQGNNQENSGNQQNQNQNQQKEEGQGEGEGNQQQYQKKQWSNYNKGGKQEHKQHKTAQFYKVKSHNQKENYQKKHRLF